MLAVCCCCALAYYALATAAGLLFSRRSWKPVQIPNPAPGVALIKPLHGWDEELAANLRSFMELDYPNPEYVFGISGDDDPARAAVDEMRRGFPDARIAQTVGDEPASNRKVGKLMRMLRRPPASEILVMSDADVRVDRDYLERLVAELDEDEQVGMVTCVYKGAAPAGSLGARLEASFINTDFTPTAILSYYLEPMRHAFASTVAIRQATLAAVGGMDSVKNAYGDDFALARRVAAAGYRIVLSSSIVTMVTEKMAFGDFWSHQMRWAKVDRKIRPVSQMRMLINGPFWAVLLLLVSGGGWPWLALALATLAARASMTAITLRKVLRLPAKLADVFLSLPKDILMQVIWFRSLAGDTVEWRGRKLRLGSSGEMEETP